MVAQDSRRDAPPGEHRIHRRRQQPGTKQIPHLVSLPLPLFGGEQACDPGKVDPTERDRQDGCPAQSHKLQVSEQVGQRKLGRAVVEDLKCHQGCKDDDAESETALQADVLQKSSEVLTSNFVLFHD